MIESYRDHDPHIHPQAFVHTSAVVIGEVRIGARSSVWPTAVLRGDQGPIEVGEDSNVQDGCVLHNTGGRSVTIVGDRVTIGHRAVIHGCRIASDCLIGMGAVVMDNAVIGSGSIVGAGAVVTMNTQVPENSLVLGSPAKVVGSTTQAHRDWIAYSWNNYRGTAEEYRRRYRE